MADESPAKEAPRDPVAAEGEVEHGPDREPPPEPKGAMAALLAYVSGLLPPRTEPTAPVDPRAIERAEKLARPLSAYFRTDIDGIANLPAGGALLVSNHGPMGFDAVELIFGIYRQVKRAPRGLADKSFFRLPFLKLLAERLGHMAGTPENAVAALEAGDLVLVYPGGAREAFKGTEGRYKLAWEKSRGFVRVAVRAGVPIVPVAGIGVDDYYRVTREPHEMAETVLGKALVGMLGHGKYAPPLMAGLGPLPLPAKLRFVIGAPLDPGLPREAADDDARVDAVREAVRTRLEGMIEDGLSRRKHPLWG